MTTAEALERMTDAGQFEILATRSLRVLELECSSIVHFGVNEQGKTISGSLDGFCLVPGSEPPLYVSAAFTLTGRKHLSGKWLASGESKPDDEAGDIVKAANKADEIRSSEPLARFTIS